MSVTLELDKADIALVCATFLAFVLFILSIFIDSWREAIGGSLPALLGVFTAAVGGVEAYKQFRK